MVAAANGVDDLRIGSGRRHFQVEARGECRHAVVDRSPVRNDEAVEAPLFAEYLGEQPMVLARVHTVDLVVRAHDRRRGRSLDGVFEAGQIDLAQRPFVDVGTDSHPVVFLVVGSEVLERGSDAA